MDPEAEVRSCVEASANVLSSEGLKEVRHFLEHGEYEMAFEGLVLELIQNDATPTGFSASKWLSVAEGLGLRVESVVVGNFWAQLAAWVASREGRRL